MSSKISLLVIYEILEMFVDTLTAGDKYSFRNSENLLQPNQMQLCKKQKILSQFFAAFLKFTSNSEHFEKEGDRHSLCISEIRNCERHGSRKV